MEKKDTNTDYPKLVSLGDQKWEIVEITIGIILFFYRRCIFAIFYTRSFQDLPEKSHPHLQCQFPPKNLIWLLSLLYKRSEKWVNLLSPSPHHPGGVIQTMTYITDKELLKCKWKKREDFWIITLKTLQPHAFNAELNFPYP